MVLGLMGAYGWSGQQNGNSVSHSNSNDDQKQIIAPQKSKWSAAEIILLTFAIIYLIFWLMMIVSAFTSTTQRGVSEKLFSVFWALLLPEVWLFAHGVDSAREGVSFFGALPAVPYQAT